MPDETIYNLLQVALSLLNQCAALLKQLDQPAQLTYVSSSLPGSTIGKHLRHITDHYALLCHAIVHQQQQQQQIQNSDMPQVDYDARLRNGPAESELEAARESVTATAEKLRQHAKDWTAEQVVRLKAKTPFSVNVGSTVGREFWFCSLHAVHHLAVVRILAAELKIDLPHDFGVAPSTLLYQQGQQG